jgi:hypothetical protein
MDSLDKMIFRLFIKPLALAGLGVGALFLLGVWIPLQLSDSRLLAPLGQMASNAALPVAGAVFLASFGMIAMRAWRLRRWRVGIGPFCHQCSGMIEEEIHRYRLRHRCLSCNQRRYL